MTSAQDPSPIRTSGVVVFDGENVLMVMPAAASKHEPGVLGLPAGRVDPGETERDAGARECREETGVIVDPAELVELPRRYRAELPRRDGTSVLMTWTVYATRTHTGALAATEETTPLWVPRHTLHRRVMQLNVADAIKQAAERLGL